ncbi:Glycosyltransferase involved in cell wall bisynthesis [Halorubrum aquaticum]|uniref:Glycosyltransferase involved in cell wall bisynthesis n=1 Tax=Halorubrum aquaticum TaxID=387340 RepID=A0A1I3A5D7_9EURY|nr:glycosyltransferase family 4 protein [Halorubrum aquaticum]SFH45343.1 Glycosyltransferase involved in cell wall bisynthesis [Halorubrum aquaticum]
MTDLGILYYVGTYPMLSESFIINEIHELKKRGHNVAVFALAKSNESITHEKHRKIDIPTYYGEISYSDFHQLASRKILNMTFNSPRHVFKSSFSIKRVLHTLLLGKKCSDFIEKLDFEIDVIHGHFAKETRLGEIHAAKYHDKPCVVTAHAVEIFKELDNRQIKEICDAMNQVIVPTRYNKQYLRNQVGIQNSISVIPATTEVDKFKYNGCKINNRILTVGRLVEKKGYKYAINSIERLVSNGYDLEYHIIGDGEDKQKLRNQINEYGIQDNVSILGNVSDERLRSEFNEANIFVLPCVVAKDGDRDAMPVVLKEAMASRTACISTTISGIPELITNEDNGILVPPRNTNALTEAIEDLLTNPDKVDQISKKGQETVEEQFDISDSVDLLVNVFKNISNNN